MAYDLVDQMHWEDLEDFLTLEQAGLEESASNSAFDCVGVYIACDWFLDNNGADYEQ